MRKEFSVILPLVLLSATPSFAQDISISGDDVKSQFKKDSYSPYAARKFPTKVLWGDTHLHTSLSLDARAIGVILSPADAFRFASGEEVTSSKGMKVKLSRPLDWLVVSDHSDAMGAMNEIVDGNPNLLKDPIVRKWYQEIKKGGDKALNAALDVVAKFTEGKTPEVMMFRSFATSQWGKYTKTADKYNKPGHFTTIIGYEWTSTTGGNNLHRNVLYRDGAVKASMTLPFTVAESDAPEDLWKWMADYEDKTGGRVLALAHNGNLSNGIMFPDINPRTGKAITKSYAQKRHRWEPLYEVTQIKGDGETHPYLSPNDEFADYETWDRNNLGPVAKEKSMLQYEYAREALKKGLKHEARLGVNPFKFGMVGSTDSHTGLATAQEDNFFGKHTGSEPNPQRLINDVGHFEKIKWPGWFQASSGYAAVWATKNTREAIFDAMERRETYATTGSRMTIRFFGGWEFTDQDAKSRLLARAGYSKGVPMGGDLANSPEGKTPTFLIGAAKDPLSGNLDRIQVIKGWLDDKGQTHEKVYNVVWSDTESRKLKEDGKLDTVGNTVDVKNATWTNTIGSPELITVWKDPDFDPKQRAFYYVRVLEIPTPRWSAYDQNRFKLTAQKDIPMITQERGYTSPIWYTPKQL